MRSPKNNAKGTSGQSYVKAQFEELEWGAAPNPEHDLGTDLLLMARDARRFDLGALVGAQVKNWSLKFAEPGSHEEVEGWWFAANEEHFEYWLNHRIPHIQVYYDRKGKVSYWVHITRDAVINTGKGRKIFVPKAQTVDAEHLDDLIAVAMSTPTGDTWEGSAWVPGQEIPGESKLRYALISPRLIAPHGNAAVEAIFPSQAIALVTAVRLGELQDEYLEKEPLLDPELSQKNQDVEWRLYAALRVWVEKGLIGPLIALPLDDGHPELRAAIVAVVAAALFEEGNVREAVNILERALADYDDYNPVDHAWLTMHFARNLVQVGQFKRAHELALDVAQIGQRASGDPTARLLSGVASDLIFSLSGWRAGNLASTIQARDTAASWWRSQTMTSGLVKHLEQAFKSWAKDRSITFNASDENWAKLRSAMLISGHAADTPNWRYETSLLAQHILMLELEVSHVISALNLLRYAGSSKELKLATQQILDRGQVEALVQVTTAIDLDQSTRDSLSSDLELLGLSGPILTEFIADQTATWLIRELTNAGERIAALGNRSVFTEDLLKTLGRIYVACSVVMQAGFRALVVALPVVDDQSQAHEYANLIRRIEDDDWTDEQISTMESRPTGDNFELHNALRTVIAHRDPSFRLTLIEGIESGDAQALASWGNVQDLPSDAAAGMLIHTAAEVRKDVDMARAGTYSFGGPSALHRLVLLNVWHPESAQWDPVVEAVTDTKSHPNDLVSGLQLMEFYAARIPEEVVKRLLIPLQLLAETTPDTSFGNSLFSESADARGDAVFLLASLFPDHVTEELLLELLRGTANQTVAAVKIVASREKIEDLPLLAVLAAHETEDVKAAVAATLADWVSLGISGDGPINLLERLLGEPGIQLAAKVTRAISYQARSTGAEVMLKLLENHPSAIVRDHVRIIRRRWVVAEQA